MDEAGGREESRTPLRRGRIDFDTGSVEEVRSAGAGAYREFRNALEYPDISDPLVPVTPNYNPYDGRVEDSRRKALSFLPRHWDLPLRTLALLAGHATWGELEVFYREPTLSHGDIPASQRLREWYSFYWPDFDTCFPEHRRLGLAHLDFRPEGGPVDGDEFIYGLVEAASEVSAALDRPLGNVILLGVLLRDYATELQWLGHSLGFSLDYLLRQALASAEEGDDPSHAYDAYKTILHDQDLPPGPVPMLAALAVLTVPELAFSLPRNDLFAALQMHREHSVEPTASSAASPRILGHANSDQPTERDRIGVRPLVEGLRGLLDDERTGLALSIGITAPWGGGKSSIMRQLSIALTEPRPGRTREWIPIRFDAWKYERSERIWAALSKAIYEQSLAAMGRWERTRFKFNLEVARRGRFSFLVVPLALTTLILAAAVALILNVSAIAGALALAATLLGFGGFAANVWGLLADPFKRAIAGYTSDPAYEEQLGFTSDADADIRLLTGMLTSSPKRVLIVFVDDLDRCSPGHVVEAVEAINQIFNAAEDSRCVFILGMDRDLISASIEVAYAETVEKLSEARQKNFGLHFLAKLVQLTVAVPAPDLEALNSLLDSIGDGASLKLPPGSPFYLEPPRRGPDGRPAQRNPETGVLPALPTPGPETGPSMLDGGSTADFGDDQVDVDESSPEFHAAERLAIRYLDPNPREIKRFDNAFRLQLHVAQRTPGCELAFDEDDLIAIGTWVAMRLRWPELAAAIDRDSKLLERLERAANDVTYVSTDTPWCDDSALTGLLREERKGRRIARLQDRTFLRIS